MIYLWDFLHKKVICIFNFGSRFLPWRSDLLRLGMHKKVITSQIEDDNIFNNNGY